MDSSKGISFVDDVAWLVERATIDEVVQRLERCTAAGLRWAEGNAVRFGAFKTEAVLFSRNRKHWPARGEKTIWVGDQAIRFAREATR